MYTLVDFKTKKALIDAIASGRQVVVYQPGPFARPTPPEGRVYLEGPHYPMPHTWYAQADVENGIIVKLVS